MNDDDLIRRGDVRDLLDRIAGGEEYMADRDRLLAEISAMPFDAMTLERAARIAEDENDAIWDHDTGEQIGQDGIARAIRALAPELAHVTAARVLLDHLENDAMTRAVSQEVWDQSCGEWQPSIPGAVEIIAAALRAIVEARQ